MTDTYIRKATPVKAYLFEGQPQVQWPDWLRDHKIATNLGIVTPALSHGVLLISQAHGPTVNVPPGSYVVLEGGKLAKYKLSEFAELFVSEDEGSVDETPVVAVETPPAAPVVEKATRGKDKAAEAPAAEEPAVEA